MATQGDIERKSEGVMSGEEERERERERER